MNLGRYVFLVLICLNLLPVAAQRITLRVSSAGSPVPGALVKAGAHRGISTAEGLFRFEHRDSSPLRVQVTHLGHRPLDTLVRPDTLIDVFLQPAAHSLEDVVVTGTMRLTSRSESPVPVELYTPRFFQKQAPPNVFEAIAMVNGVRPQLNCNICNTGDIHINGMEGAYTQVLVDGMPIVSGLSTVYGLMGIPLGMVERVEVIKGPAASLYGSEAMAGTINIITLHPNKAPRFTADLNLSSWQEWNADLGFKLSAPGWSAVTGLNYFNYTAPRDDNGDGFTDVTIQNRVSLFSNWNVRRKSGRLLTAGARLYYEDRWGGQMNWKPAFRGSDSIYGESIYTRRAEFFGKYEWPVLQDLMMNWSLVLHDQNSWYGTTPFMAYQHTGFVQLYWNKLVGNNHYLLTGAALRFNGYNDNTTATPRADRVLIPGLFVQDEWKFHRRNSLLLGLRTDHHPAHGLVVSPRLAFKWQPFERHTLRASTGTGFRVVNIFTEDHAALTGARTVVLAETLRPERSVNALLNWMYQRAEGSRSASVEGGAFYSVYSNRIIPDYDTDPNLIVYANLKGRSYSKGWYLNAEFARQHRYRMSYGLTYMDVYQQENKNGPREQQLHAPRWSGTFSLALHAGRQRNWVADLSGNVYGPMRLPILPNDFRPEYSPWFSLLHLQLSRKWNRLELYAGLKNLLDFTPKDPIMRPFDPFDRNVNDPVSNPHGYTFDPSYNYAPLQGRRGYLGLRFTMRER